MKRTLPYVLVVAWLAVAGFGAAALAGSLAGRRHALVLTASIEGWTVWAAIWCALLVPRTSTLTIARIGVPATLGVAVVAATTGGAPAYSAGFVAASLAALGALAHPRTIDAFVDGSSYGPERRFGLRTPPALALIALPLTWPIAVAVLAVPLLAAARLWIAALVVSAVWAAGARWAIRSLHLPARRWVVFVPAGMVLNDPLTLVDAVLLPRREIAGLGPAFAGSDATDLSRGALGLVLQIDLTEPFEVPLRIGRRRESETISTDRIMFAVLRPGALLESAAGHRVRVGATRPDPDVDETQTAVPLPTTRSPR